ncbi:hypothetical protein [Planosporangium mesophilum]|uniref:Uncharacterized protein n=1 Tax=Planosporangium mesophilum TaxID=689768 RepID=A0A8J3X497_9ACTN|nr:hypothetical protein [Planosporangium mesophilum]GII26389.1 hypothetical protein Pme01_59860 [Planosporangium mesophilum]
MDERETAAAHEGGTSRAVPEAGARTVVDPVATESADGPPTQERRANIGRASAPTASPPEPVAEHAPATPTTYRAGELSPTDPPADSKAGELPVRTPGQTVIEAESPWDPFGSATPQQPTPVVARARASVPGAAPVTATEMVDAVPPGPTEPRTYRAGETEPADSAPADPPPPAEPPPPPQPPEPVSPPEPPSPPQPAEPPPGPTPFPSPQPVPTPPRPVPPEPPAPEPEPGPPHPPSPPLPPPPGPSPFPPFPPPPPAIGDQAPHGPASYYPPGTPTPGPSGPWAPTSGSPPGPYDGWSQQGHPQGTVYSGSPVTSQPLTFNPVEQSGSLTGHILSQGTDAPPPKARTTRVIVIMTVVLTVVVITGLTLAVFARNALLGMFSGG